MPVITTHHRTPCLIVITAHLSSLSTRRRLAHLPYPTMVSRSPPSPRAIAAAPLPVPSQVRRFTSAQLHSLAAQPHPYPTAPARPSLAHLLLRRRHKLGTTAAIMLPFPTHPHHPAHYHRSEGQAWYEPYRAASHAAAPGTGNASVAAAK
ncbi:hypothetical protein GUJ93_ZPchr0002g26485 [Zizania palustris]|uniref:Uncharacterized protein n=1 Tax=Zizania palustris TaxID=103762 RepID=A0A8J5S106_ZIZPA|nr:hypothetical protein GUJ93_ZPchr0002g26485 [Zizania palustris]